MHALHALDMIWSADLVFRTGFSSPLLLLLLFLSSFVVVVDVVAVAVITSSIAGTVGYFGVNVCFFLQVIRSYTPIIL